MVLYNIINSIDINFKEKVVYMHHRTNSCMLSMWGDAMEEKAVY